MPGTESALIQAILDNPGDEVSRLALADFLEEHQRDRHGLRQTGWGWWEVVYAKQRRDWHLWWRYERPEMQDRVGLWRTAVLIYKLTQKGLPKCSECGKRAHWASRPSWQWLCKRIVCNKNRGKKDLEQCKQAAIEK